MDFEGAVRAHTEWKIKLAGYLRNPNKSLSPDDVQKDDRCALGQWIHGHEGKKLEGRPEFAELKKKHAQFHIAAADVIRRADTDAKNLSEEVALGGSSAYAQASSSVVAAIFSIKREFTAGAKGP